MPGPEMGGSVPLGLLLGCLESRSSQLRSASTPPHPGGATSDAVLRCRYPQPALLAQRICRTLGKYGQHMAVPQRSTCRFRSFAPVQWRDSAPKTPVSCATMQDFAQHGDRGLDRVGRSLAGCSFRTALQGLRVVLR